MSSSALPSASATTPSTSPGALSTNPLAISALLQYRFDSINNNQISDHGTLGLNGSIVGACTLVNDVTMGPCLQFDGSSGYITVPSLNANFSQGFTLTAWVNFAAFENYSRIIDFGNGQANDNLVLNNGQTDGTLIYDCCQQSSCLECSAINVLSTNEWLHVAVSVDAQGLCTLYIDGGPVSTQTNKAYLPLNVQRNSNFIGKSNWSGNGLFSGKMAWLSMYAEALSPASILADMNQALIERGAFRTAFPINFSLTTNNQGAIAPVIYLESAQNPEVLCLSIQNCTNTTLTLQTTSVQTASDANYHFQLLFRPGIISQTATSNGKITCTPQNNSSSDNSNSDNSSNSSDNAAWQVAVGVDSNGNTYLSLLATGSALPQIKASSAYRFTITGLQASPIGGTRATNVSLNYQHIAQGANTAALQGQRLQHLDIISHIGNKNIPLNLDIVGSPTLLNDGASPNELLLRITNISDQSISLSTNPTAPSAFSICAVGQPEDSVMEWALAEMDNLQNVLLQWGVVAIASGNSSSTLLPLSTPLLAPLSANATINIVPPPQQKGATIATSVSQHCDEGATTLTISHAETIAAGAMIVVTNNGQNPWLPPASTTDVASKTWKILNNNQASLAPGASLTCYLGNIVTGVKSGNSALTINYTNIPAYWDGSLQVSVRKGPLVERGNAVGIATNTPAYTLDVQGDARVAKTARSSAGPSLVLENTAGGSGATASLYFKSYATEGQAASSAIIAQDNGNYSNNILFQTKDAGSSNNPLVTRVTIDASGNMAITGTISGIGMAPPGAIIMQSGGISGNYDNTGKGVSGTAYEGWAICNGQNNTPDLQDRFIVGAGGDASANTSGGPDSHEHSTTIPAKAFSTSNDGEHAHQMPSTWYNRGLSCGKHNGIDRSNTDVTSVWSQSNGEHSHSVPYNDHAFNSNTYNGLNRPKYYALYFIMRLSS